MVTVPIRVTWGTMMAGKLAMALRPSRLALMALTVGLVGVWLSMQTDASLLRSVPAFFVAFVGLRLAVMGVSAALDAGARRYDGATLNLDASGLALTFADNEVVRHPWSWVLGVTERPGGFAIRVDERGGRFWLFLSAREGLRERLVGAGKLA